MSQPGASSISFVCGIRTICYYSHKLSGFLTCNEGFYTAGSRVEPLIAC
jgi:hypothetical protein